MQDENNNEYQNTNQPGQVVVSTEPQSSQPVAPPPTPSTQVPPQPAPQPKKHSHFWQVTSLIVAVVVVLTGLGGWYWYHGGKVAMSSKTVNSNLLAKKGILGSLAAKQQDNVGTLQTAESAIQSVNAALSDHEVTIDTSTVASMKQQGAKEIIRRLVVLHGLADKINASTNLSAADRDAMLQQIGGEEAGLPQLLNKINKDTTVPELKADVSSIYTEYRVYRLILPKAALLVANDRLAKTGNDLKAQVTKIDTALAGAKAKHQDVSKLQSLRNQMVNKITSAASLTADISNHVRNLTPQDWNNDHTVLTAQEKPLAMAKQDQTDASNLSQQILGGLAKLPVNPTPNIVFILTDDQSLNLTKFMPNTNKLIAGQGASFSNYFDNISLCCAARTSIMRGQYAHNSGVQDNDWPDGGFSRFYQLGDQNSTIATWLNKAGYTTSLMGKYLNGYPGTNNSAPANDKVTDTWIPPGWNDWFVPVHGGPYTEYNYTVNDNGVLHSYAQKPSDYMVDVISQRATKYITDHKNSAKPYFMYLAPYSPHSNYEPAPRYANTENNLNYPITPDIN